MPRSRGDAPRSTLRGEQTLPEGEGERLSPSLGYLEMGELVSFCVKISMIVRILEFFWQN